MQPIPLHFASLLPQTITTQPTKFRQELCVWRAIKHVAELHDVLAKRIDFRTARSKAQEMLGFE